MITTALLIEFFIIGLQTFIWLSMLVLCLIDFDWISIDVSKFLSPVIIIFIAPIIYPLGLFIDDFADLLSEPWKIKIKADLQVNKPMTAYKLLFISQDEWLRKYFDYIRIRIRLSRSSALFFGIMTLIFPLFTYFRLKNFLGELTTSVIRLGVFIFPFFAILSACSWRSFTKNFYKRIKEGFEIYQTLNVKGNALVTHPTND